MCFAPEADLVAGVVISAIGIDTLRRTERPELLPLAALPLVFGVHQLAEALVWWHLRGDVSDCVGEPATWLYALIALGLVPVLVPFAFLRGGILASTTLGRGLLGAGTVSAGVLVVRILDEPLRPSIEGNHIDYHVGTPWLPLTLGLYILATCAPALLSQERSLRLFGATNLVVVVLLIWLAQSALVSLWCFWAAISSVLINVYVRGRASAGISTSSMTGAR